jgi:hypothetical protein
MSREGMALWAHHENAYRDSQQQLYQRHRRPQQQLQYDSSAPQQQLDHEGGATVSRMDDRMNVLIGHHCATSSVRNASRVASPHMAPPPMQPLPAGAGMSMSGLQQSFGSVNRPSKQGYGAMSAFPGGLSSAPYQYQPSNQRGDVHQRMQTRSTPVMGTNQHYSMERLRDSAATSAVLPPMNRLVRGEIPFLGAMAADLSGKKTRGGRKGRGSHGGGARGGGVASWG